MSKNNYYKKGGYELIEVLRSFLSEREFAGLCKGSALQYIVRAGHKTADESEDVKKAIDYLAYLLKKYEKETKSRKKRISGKTENIPNE